MNKSVVLCALVFLLHAGTVFAQDYGLILRQTPALTGGEMSDGEAGVFSYTGTAVPWFAAPLGEKADLYFSGGMSAELENEIWKPVPELYRFECIYNPRADMSVELGRVPF